MVIARTHIDEADLPAIADRFRNIYVGAVCDILDSYGLRYQFMHHSIMPLDSDKRVAGPAFTIVGMPNATTDNSKRMGPRVIDALTPGVVAVYETNGDQQTGVWGELWSAGAAHRGCVGAVVDGGIRDTAYIRSAGFPIFHRFTAPGDAVGRFNIVEYQTSVSVGGVRVSPGDYVFGDEDGVVIIPRELTLEVLEKAEGVKANEDEIRVAIGKGERLADLYKKFGRF